MMKDMRFFFVTRGYARTSKEKNKTSKLNRANVRHTPTLTE